MKEILGRTVIAIVLLILSFLILNSVKIEKSEVSEFANLVIFGDNIDSERKPFVEENGGIYLPLSTISKVIDEKIYYDKVATKVIVTTEDKVIKMKLDENKMFVNFEGKDISTPAKLKNGYVYLDINLLKDVYGIIVDYNKETKTISIDNVDGKSTVKFNKTYVYSDITTKSNVIDKLEKDNVIMVYDKSLEHNRWYKVKTKNNIIGYIAKNSVNFVSQEEKDTQEENKDTNKYIMFWQYGSNLTSLEEKIDGVNVVSPTWYELSNSSGDISSDFSKEYYNKAKEYGYEIWPIITNGIDSASYTPEDTSAMLNSEYSREIFIKNLLKICLENKLDGINMDFESMKTEDRDLYTQLIREMSPIFRNKGLIVSVDTYFVEYIDRKNVGAACDYVILMGYDHRGAWSQVSGPIAEIPWVEENINSLINDSKIPANKVILGIPFYTRLWIEKDGEAKPTTKVYDMEDCQEFIDYYNLKTTYDEGAGQNYVEHKKGNIKYKLWIEDQKSIKNRVELVNKYNLAGISGWRKGLETDETWKTITTNINKK